MPRKSRKNVGLIGLGIVGSRVAAGLRACGFHVFVWNRTIKPAPNFVGSPAEIAELCDIIQLFVADAQAVFDVIEQMKDSLGPQHVIVCNATIGPEATLEAARVVEETGAHFLDAPFTGSKGAAEKRSLVYYIGGDEATFLRARPVLEATSKAIVRIGGIGHAATVKVVTNMIAAVSIQTLSEALAIVQKAGLDPEVLGAALEQNACRSATMDMKLPKMIAADYEPHFSLKHMFKDVQLGIHIANALDIEIPATTVTAGVMYGALNQNWGDLDFSALYKIYDTEAGSAASAELQSGYAQIEDLDAKEVHYPETRVPAPPRPESEAANSEPASILEAEPSAAAATSEALPVPAPEPPKVEVPTLASALGAPAEAAPEHGATAHQVVLPGHAGVPGVILLAPMDAGAAPPVGTVLVGAPESAAPATNGERAAEPAKEEASARVEEAKVVEFPTTRAEADAPQPAAEKSAERETAQPNGNFAQSPEGVVKPFNFVKRWFVSRIGS